MAAPVGGNELARRVVDDLIDFSGQTSIAQLNALIAEMEAFDDPCELVTQTQEEIEIKEAQLESLFVVKVNDMYEACMEILLVNPNKSDIETGHRLKALNCSYLYVSYGAEYCIIPAHLVSQPYLVYMGPFFILDKLFEVAKSSRLVDKIKYMFGHSRGEDESFAGLMRNLCLSLRISLSKKRRLIAKLEAVREVGVSLKAGFVADVDIYIYILSVKLLTMAALYILDKLAEVADSSHLQDKMKVVFVQACGADESFIALMRDLCSVIRVSIAKNRRLIAELETLGQLAEALKPLDYMKETVVHDSTTLGVLEQLLAGTHVGMRLKVSYVAEMEETE
ncbi:hypothetical protein Tco_0321604 [Tanacetum coccineum]